MQHLQAVAGGIDDDHTRRPGMRDPRSRNRNPGRIEGRHYCAGPGFDGACG
jgi:hypothetical protein